MNTAAAPVNIAHRRFEALDALRGVCAILVVMFWNFLANRYWTYSDIAV